MLDERKRRDRLTFSVFKHLEVVLGETADEISLLIGHQRVHLDKLDLGLEGRCLCGRLARLGLAKPELAAIELPQLQRGRRRRRAREAWTIDS